MLKLNNIKLRAIIKEEIKKVLEEGDVVSYGTFKQMKADQEQEKVGQKKAQERIEQIRREILDAFTNAVNDVKTRVYDEEDPQFFDDAARTIGPTDLYKRFTEWVLESEDEII